MCNIAGYIGNKPAAPILIEMLRKQEWLDGGLSTGIATIHNGVLYHAKVIGGVDELIKQTDALSFPGNIGIIHSRPDGNLYEYAHPFVSKNDSMAFVENGNCCRDEESVRKRNAVTDLLSENGVRFKSAYRFERSSYPKMQNGEYVAYGEVIAHYVAYLKDKTGDSYEKIMADVHSEMFSDVVGVMINTDCPENIFVTRISRPMNIMIADGESYIATSQLGFPELENVDYIGSLPQMCSSVVTKGGFQVTNHRVKGGHVEEFTFSEFLNAYERIKTELTNRTVNMEELGALVFSEPPTIMANDLQPRAKLIYDVLYALKKSGTLTLSTEEIELPWLAGQGQTTVKRYSFSYEEKKL